LSDYQGAITPIHRTLIISSFLARHQNVPGIKTAGFRKIAGHELQSMGNKLHRNPEARQRLHRINRNAYYVSYIIGLSIEIERSAQTSERDI